MKTERTIVDSVQWSGAAIRQLRLVGMTLRQRSCFFVTGFFLSLTSIAIFNIPARADGGTTATVTVNGQDPASAPSDYGVVRIGDSAGSMWNASANPGGTSGTWSWSVSGDVSGSIPSGSNTSSLSATFLWSTAGTGKTFSVNASVTSPYDASGSGSFRGTATVVEVSSISLKAGKKHYVGKTMVKDDFDIVTNPAGYESMVNVNSVTLQSGSNTITANCGTSSTTCNVDGIEIQVTADIGGGSVNFTYGTFTANFGFVAGAVGDDGSYYFSGDSGTGMSSGTVADGDTIGLPVTVTQTDSSDSDYAQYSPISAGGLAGISSGTPSYPEILADGGLTFFLVVGLVVVVVSVSGCSSGGTTIVAAPPPTIGYAGTVAAGGVQQLSINAQGATSVSTVTAAVTGNKATSTPTKTPPGAAVGGATTVMQGAQSFSVGMGAPAPAALNNLGGSPVNVQTAAGVPNIGLFRDGATPAAVWKPTKGAAIVLTKTGSISMRQGLNNGVRADGTATATW